MNAETRMAERLLQVIKPRQDEHIELAADAAPEVDTELKTDWLQLAGLLGYGMRGVRELTSPLSD